ncbi:MAG: type II toxin-antitoxin system VapC family toxin [Saprospirales bacterium]|nr:type II toxin-antitoxin system VapC family toxin [Saprospirales bacterium]
MEIICIDTNLLIDYYRKKDKTQTRLRLLAHQFQIVVPAIVAYEFIRGDKGSEPDVFLDRLFAQTSSLAFDLTCARKAAEIWRDLKAIGKSIEPEDLFIATTALVWGYRLATNNHKHFEFIPGIRFV